MLVYSPRILSKLYTANSTCWRTRETRSDFDVTDASVSRDHVPAYPDNDPRHAFHLLPTYASRACGSTYLTFPMDKIADDLSQYLLDHLER